MQKLSEQELTGLKTQFATIGCAVEELRDNKFYVVSREFPVLTHVLANPYFIELTTWVFAKKGGYFSGGKSRLLAFVNEANQSASLAKFICDSNQPDKEGWPIRATIKFLTGVTGCQFENEALKNLLTLWLRDISKLLLDQSKYEMHTVMRPANQ